MRTPTEQKQAGASRAATGAPQQLMCASTARAFEDRRPVAAAQRKMQQVIAAGRLMPPAQRQLSCNPVQRVVQLAETLAQKVKRILGVRNIIVSDEKAQEYADLLNANQPNVEIQVAGHHRALKKNAIGTVSSIARREPCNAANMRVSPYHGPMNVQEDSMVDEGRRPIVGNIFQQDVTISAADLKNIGPRGNLGSLMGGSASQLSGIANSEWLHAVAHSLGGADQVDNLAAGPHSLNTAMIPFESAVKKLVYAGHVVDYSVTFFTDEMENGLSYITFVEIGMQVNKGDRKDWFLKVNQADPSKFINGQVLHDIEKIAASFVQGHV